MNSLKTLVIPIYRNEENIPRLFDALDELARRLNGPLEVIFVNDASPDQSAQAITLRLPDRPFQGRLVHHSRNFGSFAAITTEIQASTGDTVAVMAADLQEPIDLIEQFFVELDNDSVDIVVGARQKRFDGAVSSFFSRMFWALFRRLVEPSIPRGGVDVFGCTRQVADIISRLPEANSSLIGLLYWVGFNRVEVPYERLARQEGRSAWSFRRRFRYLTDSIFSFTSLPISIILLTGAIGGFVALGLSIVVFVSWLQGNIEEPGYTALALIQLGSTAALLLAVGVVGSYVWRAFDNSKNRPKAIVRH